LKTISLKHHPSYNEAWLQQVIANDPGVLGLGPLIVKDRERSHRGGGRLDMLLQDEDGTARYEVELQLGATDDRTSSEPSNTGIVSAKSIRHTSTRQSLSRRTSPRDFSTSSAFSTGRFPLWPCNSPLLKRQPGSV
jgi:hypothetical protein